MASLRAALRASSGSGLVYLGALLGLIALFGVLLLLAWGNL